MQLNIDPSHALAEPLLNWYEQSGRLDLPWRQNISAYRVWISEIMLQQTQVKTVIPYFQKFLEHFPNIVALAEAPEDAVLHLWAGLGYYSRARNLHRAAKQIVSQFAGQFPQDLQSLQTLPGIGRSTAGAILAIAYNLATPILDGNVKRILARVAAISGPTSKAAVSQKLWQLAEYYTPQQRTADYTQAIMDLGATVCTRTQAKCSICPLQNACQAYAQGEVALFPTPPMRKKKPVRVIKMLIFYNPKTNTVLLEKRPSIGIWGGLWSLPECAVEEDLIAFTQKHYGCKIVNSILLPEIKHVFTHFQLNILPIHINQFVFNESVMDSRQQIWYNLIKPEKLGLAAPVKRLLEQLSK